MLVWYANVNEMKLTIISAPIHGHADSATSFEEEVGTDIQVILSSKDRLDNLQNICRFGKSPNHTA